MYKHNDNRLASTILCLLLHLSSYALIIVCTTRFYLFISTTAEHCSSGTDDRREEITSARGKLHSDDMNVSIHHQWRELSSVSQLLSSAHHHHSEVTRAAGTLPRLLLDGTDIVDSIHLPSPNKRHISGEICHICWCLGRTRLFWGRVHLSFLTHQLQLKICQNWIATIR